jgi:hypothetical protein
MKPYIILLLLVALAFANSLQNEFVWDDRGLIVDNPQINLSLSEIPSVFTTPLWELAGFQESRQVYYRPIAYLYSVLNYKIWGLNPLGFHLTNIILHLINVIFLYRVGLLLLSSHQLSAISYQWSALIAASIFAVHPVHNESVGRVAIGEVIFGFFIILSIYFFLKEKRYLSWITFSLALFSKEAAVMLPFALVILATHREGIKKGLIAIIPYMILVGAYLILRTQVVDTVFGDKVSQPIFTRILTMLVATFDYIRLLIIPYPISPFYPARWYASIFEPKVLIAIAVLALISYLAFKMRRDKVMLFLLSFPFVMLAPVIWRVNTFPTGQDLGYIYERFLYVPVMLFSLFVSGSFLRYVGDTKKKYMLVGGVMVIGIFAVITIYSNRIWTNNFTLFKKIIEKSPNAVFAHHGLANAYKEIGDMDKALQEWQKVVEINPFKSDVHNSIGNVYMLKGDYGKAIYSYLMAIKIDPNNPEAYYNLALVLEKTGKEKDASIYYKEFIKMAPESYKDIILELKKRFGNNT